MLPYHYWFDDALTDMRKSDESFGARICLCDGLIIIDWHAEMPVQRVVDIHTCIIGVLVRRFPCF